MKEEPDELDATTKLLQTVSLADTGIKYLEDTSQIAIYGVSQLYLNTSQLYVELTYEVCRVAGSWFPFRGDVDKCQRPPELDTLAIQLFTDEGLTIKNWACGLDTENCWIDGPFLVKAGGINLKLGAMVVSPLIDKPEPSGAEGADKISAQEPIVYMQLLTKDGYVRFPVKWQARYPVLVPENGALVLVQGHIKFYIVHAEPKKEQVS